MIRRPPSSPLFPYTPLFRSCYRENLCRYLIADLRLAQESLRPAGRGVRVDVAVDEQAAEQDSHADVGERAEGEHPPRRVDQDRKSTRLNSSHLVISYAVFCL